MTLNDAYIKCEHGSNLIEPKSDQEKNFFQNLFANEDFWALSDTDSFNLKHVVCKLDVLGKLFIS